MESLIEKLRAYLDSDEGKRETEEYSQRVAEESAIRERRVNRVGEFLKEKDFDQIIQRIVWEHDDEYRERCYSRGYEPYPNHKTELLFDFVRSRVTDVHNDLIPQDFLSECLFYKGYWFTTYCGQGCFYRIYDHKINIILQI
jgi:hypothetical protein